MTRAGASSTVIAREGTAEAIAHLKDAVRQGRPWPRALLEAIALWTAPQEAHRGRHFCYLLGGEALDWLLLAERLLLEVDEYVPPEEVEELLFTGRLPEPISPQEFRDLIGPEKYRAYLNYWYGIVIEEALLDAVEVEVQKARRARGLLRPEEFQEEAFQHVYGAPRLELLQRFRRERGYEESPCMNLTEAKEFTYWLFKYRVRTQDAARVASDTRKGLERLHALVSVNYEDPD